MVDELGRDPAFRLDLFVKDVPRAATLFQAAAKAVGLTVAVDATAQDRLRKKLPTALVVYTDSLTPEEVARPPGRLAERGPGRQVRPRCSTTAHLVTVQAPSRRSSRDLLGVDLGFGKRQGGYVAIEADLCGPPTSSARTDEPAAKPAIVLTYLPAAVPGQPVRLEGTQAFLDRRDGSRRDAGPTVIRLLIVIRPAL